MEKKTSTPSTVMSDGQIDKITANVRAGISKNRQRFSLDDVQEAMEHHGLDAKIISAVEATIEEVIVEVGNTIVRIAEKVDRTRTPQQVLDATKREPYTDKSVVATMPPEGDGIQENVEVVFFKVNRYIGDDDLDKEKEYEKRGLKPDPYAQAAVNEADPEFADKYPNGTHWKDSKNRWCFLYFSRAAHGRRVLVCRHGNGWPGHWWFGGVRKLRHSDPCAI